MATSFTIRPSGQGSTVKVIEIAGKFTDDFNRADGPLGDNWEYNDSGTGIEIWTDGDGDKVTRMTSGVEKSVSVSASVYDYSTVTASSQSAEMTIKNIVSGRWIGPGLRIQPDGRCYALEVDGGGTSGIWYWNGDPFGSGNTKVLDFPTGEDGVDGDVYRFTMIDTTMTVYRNGRQIAQGTNSNLPTGSVGIIHWFGSTTATQYRFEARDLSVPYSYLRGCVIRPS